MKVTQENYFDIAEACHTWLSLNHEGQFSHTYALLSRSKFRPGPMWRESRVEEENEFFPLINKNNVEELMDAIDTLIENNQKKYEN